MQVHVLTEGGGSAGLGHVIRCKALSQAFARRGFPVKMWVQGEESIISFLNGVDFQFCDWRDEGELPKGGIVMVDSYQVTDTRLSELVEKAGMAVFMDDNASRDYPDSVIINGNIHAAYLPYSESHLNLLGSKYALLREEFVEVGEKEIREEINTCLLTIGGKDLHNLIPGIMAKLHTVYPNWKIDVVVTRSFDNLEEIESQVGENDRIFRNPDARTMCNLILGTDIAICGGGQTLNELARCGTPAVAIGIAENQYPQLARWQEEEVIEYPGNHDHSDLENAWLLAVNRLIPQQERQDRSAKGRQLIDGKGSDRIAKTCLASFLQSDLQVREAISEDVLAIYEISNQSAVRESSFNNQEIPLEDHKSWYSGKLKDPDHLFLVGTLDEAVIGQIRFQAGENACATVSISSHTRYAGLGAGSLLMVEGLVHLKFWRPDLKEVIALIKMENTASIRYFEKMKFKFVREFPYQGYATAEYRYQL